MHWMKSLVMALLLSLVSSLKNAGSMFRGARGTRCLHSLPKLQEISVNSWKISCETPESIEAFGSRVASIVGSSDIILLKGDLGAGKTTFTRGLIRAKFEDEDMRVTSPSYLLDNEYEYDEGQFIHHMDLYRLPTGCDLSILGIPAIYSTSLCIIEWPQRMGDSLPSEYLDIDISIHRDETRTIELIAVGHKWIEKMKILESDFA
jgi:tRNA threonylcarbamoyladenosine biosynthesis protein TsaE